MNAIKRYFSTVKAEWKADISQTYDSVIKLLEMGLHGGGRGNVFATVIIELMYLMFAFVILVGMIVVCVVMVIFMPAWVLVMSILQWIVGMAQRGCK